MEIAFAGQSRVLAAHRHKADLRGVPHPGKGWTLLPRPRYGEALSRAR